MDYSPLEKKIRLKFKDRDLLENLFVHRSYLNECRTPGLESNERLEFLGDAVLELVVTEYLYKNYPNDEGELTNWRSALVKGANLAKVAKAIELGQYLQLSRGEEKSGGRSKDYILANTVEALIGAMYLDAGYEAASTFINDFILVSLEEILKAGEHIDAKSRLQEVAQDKKEVTPHYQVESEEGPDHDKVFTMGVYFGEQKITTGEGSSKQKAEQDAARAALQKMGW